MFSMRARDLLCVNAEYEYIGGGAGRRVAVVTRSLNEPWSQASCSGVNGGVVLIVKGAGARETLSATTARK